MAGDDAVVVPRLNDAGAVGEGGAVLAAGQVVEEAALPEHVAAGVHEGVEDAGEEARGGVLERYGARVLFGGGEVEEQVGLDQRAGRFVVEHEFAVLVRVHVFVVELGVEFRRDLHAALVGRGEDVLEFDPLRGRVFFPFFRQTVRSDHFGFWVFFAPRCDEDVMFDIRGHDVLECAQGRNFGFDLVGQGDRGEDGYGAGL